MILLSFLKTFEMKRVRVIHVSCNEPSKATFFSVTVEVDSKMFRNP